MEEKGEGREEGEGERERRRGQVAEDKQVNNWRKRDSRPQPYFLVFN